MIPLTIVLATAAYPRGLAAPAAATITLLGITASRCARADLAFWQWDPTWVTRELTHPLSAMGCFTGLGFALLLLPFAKKFRCVGINLPAGSCKHCGYNAGSSKICPECGKPNLSATV